MSKLTPAYRVDTLDIVANFNQRSENNRLNYLSYEWDKPLIYTVISRNPFSCGISQQIQCLASLGENYEETRGSVGIVIRHQIYLPKLSFPGLCDPHSLVRKTKGN
jgi:hypothetical protein